jgi:LPPG:FO 2-phospho-L-lactate transferase
MLASLGDEVSAVGVARRYAGIVDAFVLDELDGTLSDQVRGLGMEPIVADTIMRDDADRARLASELLGSLSGR